ncbi:hypothetical protein V6C03_13265 [Methyloligella sp. 2.7D]|uniref:hypothetical protein n=1 Tax=unclassified Methyloligella TaxID=2625955 RepID=UPI00157C1A7D|nr:hypothetical protein [Methyloligella sp. GL2]QKP77258.1 hypothetical protein HT051_07200 [Methyloligella sp. GL2]
MPPPIGEVLCEFDAALAETPHSYERLIAAFRALKLPADVSAAELSHLLAVCYRILQLDSAEPPLDLTGDLEAWQIGHLAACARSDIEEVMYDRNAHTRAWIAERRAWFAAGDKETPEGLNDSQLPPALDIPWDKATAAQEIRPFLKAYEAYFDENPNFHFQLCWYVSRDGYPVFKQVVADWMAELAAKSLGTPGMAEAIAQAGRLYDKEERDETLSWVQCAGDVLSLLDHPHPMVAAASARYLGWLYDNSIDEEPGAARLADMLKDLAARPRYRAELCGAFVCGFDSACQGLYGLKADKRLEGAGFDLDRWVLDGLAPEKEEIYLPNAQALWFYVHEHYCADPAFVTKLIEADRAWIAMMCATELNEKVEGMDAVLTRLAKDSDPEIASGAQYHLMRYYAHGD